MGLKVKESEGFCGTIMAGAKVSFELFVVSSVQL